MALLSFGYWQQGYPLPSSPGEPGVPALMFFTLGAAIVIGVVSFAYFLQRKANREAAERALQGNGAVERSMRPAS
jgi:hypothetical protein